MSEQRRMMFNSELSDVTDGMIRWWDGIENTPSGHQTSPTRWTDKIGSIALGDRTHTGSFDENGLTAPGLYDSNNIGFISKASNFTMETTYTINSYKSALPIWFTYYSGSSVGNYGFGNDDNGNIYFWGSGGTLTTSVKVNLNTPNTIAFSYNGSQIRMYLNGTFIQSFNYSTNFITSFSGKITRICANNSNYNISISKIFSVRAWDRVLSDKEIKQSNDYLAKYYNI